MGGTFFVSRRELNRHDTQFHLKFVERIYPGSPRWWSDEWKKHSIHGDRLDREPGVIDLIREAGDFENRKFKKYYTPRSAFLVSCVNPECSLRSWVLSWYEDTSPHTKSHTKMEVKNDWRGSTPLPFDDHSDAPELYGGLQAMATGKMEDFARTECPRCSKKRAVFGFSTIKDKWVYVLKESGGSLVPHVEVYLYSKNGESALDVHNEYAGGRFTEKKDSPDSDGLILPHIEGHTWHFFLSPVRLGPQALRLLVQAPKQDSHNAKNRDADEPSKWDVAVLSDLQLQPWVTTVKRKFQPDQRLKTPFEFVPLVDPFSWVAQAYEFDYLPIVAAQQKLIQDPNEQAKAFIASTLAQVIGTKRDSNDPSSASPDPWSVKDVTAVSPQAWMDRYHAATEFVIKETNNAACRVTFPLRFSWGHRVIESACQEAINDPDVFALGFVHWAHVLRDIMICPAGQALVCWLAKNKDAADRIPQKNVLRGEGLGDASKVGATLGHSLLLHILAYVSPMIIAKSPNPSQDMSQRLKHFGIETKTLGPKIIVEKANEALEIPVKFVEYYKKKFAEVLDPDEFRKTAGMQSFVGGLQSFSHLKDALGAVTLLSDLSEWLTEDHDDLTSFDRLGSGKRKIETVTKLTQYVNDRVRKLIRQGVDFQKGYAEYDLKIEQDIADKLMKEGASTLEGAEVLIVRGSRSLNFLKLTGKLKKILAGPVAFVIGVANIALKFDEAEEALKEGNTGKAVGSTVELMGNVLFVYAAFIESVNLFIGVELLAAGPMGWIAAACIVIGVIVGIFSAEKNDLQLFTSHCFLGNKFREESEDKRPPWMAKLKWNELAEPANARWALLRMITGFITHTGLYASQRTSWIATGVGGIIFPSYIPDGAYFEVQVDWAPRGVKPGNEPSRRFAARIWPLVGDKGDWMWLGNQPDDRFIDIERRGAQVTVIQVHPKPNFTGPTDHIFRVRLVYDSSQQNTLPAEGWVENESVHQTSGFNDVSS